MLVFEQDCYWVVSHELLTAKPFNLALNYVNGNQKLLCLSSFLGRLPKVDLIILEGKNVRTSVRPSVRPQKVSSI